MLILIGGPPASGKTTLAYELSKLNGLNLFSLDDYVNNDETIDIPRLSNAVGNKPAILEGTRIQSILDNRTRFPRIDLVIELVISYNAQREIYMRERDMGKFTRIPPYKHLTVQSGIPHLMMRLIK